MPEGISDGEQLEHLGLALVKAKVEVPRVFLPESHHVVLDSIRIHYVDWGNPSAPPIVLLHGGALTARSWDLVCLELSADHHCVAPDLRGHGDSEWPADADYSLDTGAHDLGRLVDSLGLDRFVLVGMSLGGLHAMTYAMRRSNRLLGLVLVDIAPISEPAGVARIRSFTNQDQELDSVEEFVARALSFNPRRDPILLRRSLLHNLRQLPSGRWTWKWDRRRHSDPEEFDRARRTLWDTLDQISCPTLLVRGEESDILSRETAEEMVSHMSNARLVEVPRAGHTIQGDNPAGLLAAMRPFLAGVEPPR
jgi:esterase